MKEAIAWQLEKSLPKFLERGNKVGWQERSILLSEAFAFCAMGDLFDIDVILESGIWLGRSTEIWARYFYPKRVTAIDCSLKKEVEDRLAEYDNLTLLQGEGPDLIPKLLEKPETQRVAVFIDGPKSHRAVMLAAKCLTYSKVFFVAVHDMQSSSAKQMVRSLGYPVFFTDAEWFLKKYSKIDRGESRWDEKQRLKWIPYHIVSKVKNVYKRLESYGMTIAFIFNFRRF